MNAARPSNLKKKKVCPSLYPLPSLSSPHLPGSTCTRPAPPTHESLHPWVQAKARLVAVFHDARVAVAAATKLHWRPADLPPHANLDFLDSDLSGSFIIR